MMMKIGTVENQAHVRLQDQLARSPWSEAKQQQLRWLCASEATEESKHVW